jgi:hypothetical protein
MMILYLKEKLNLPIIFIDEKGTTLLHQACYQNNDNLILIILAWNIVEVNRQDS